jgi:hypothetical protein
MCVTLGIHHEQVSVATCPLSNRMKTMRVASGDHDGKISMADYSHLLGGLARDRDLLVHRRRRLWVVTREAAYFCSIP